MKANKRIKVLATCVFSACILISCVKEPTACFTIASTHIELGDTARFINCSSNASSYLWDFGDGQTSKEASPMHIYNDIGNFEVKMTAWSKGEKKEDVVNLSITVTGGACFTISSGTAYTGDTLTFTNCSTMCQAYSWDFGDGNTSAEAEPNHVYHATGNYLITLHATLNNGSVSTATDHVTILQPPKK